MSADDRPVVLCVGIATNDEILTVDDLPAGDGKWSASARSRVGGGVAANAAVAVTRLGGRGRLWSAVGDDASGTDVVDELRSDGVDVSLVVRVDDHPTPHSVVVIDRSGRRQIVNHLAPGFFEAAGDDLAATAAEAVDPSTMAVVVDGRWPAAAEQALLAARRRRIPGILDLDRPILLPSASTTAASHVIAGRDALAATTGRDDPAEGLQVLSEATDAWVAVTLGAEGVLWADDAGLHHLPATPVETVDTLAAGDVFHGAFGLALAEGHGEEAAVRFASLVAAVKCGRPGGRHGIPDRLAVETARLERLDTTR